MKAKAATPSKRNDTRPTPDQMYLATKLNGHDFEAEYGEDNLPIASSGHHITPAALQKWNLIFGVAAVSDALRMAWGHPPLAGIDNPWAYVDGILRSGS